MIECHQPQAHPARCGCEQETSAGREFHASESGFPYAVRAASSASFYVSPAIIASDPRLMKAESSAERTLRNLGYTDNGGDLWKPPIGEKPNFSLIDALRQQLADVSNERDALAKAVRELESGLRIVAVAGKGSGLGALRLVAKQSLNKAFGTEAQS